MKQLFITTLMTLFALVGYGQEKKSFKGHLYNSEYNVYMRINFHDKNIVARGSMFDSRLWLITDVKINKDKEAKLSIINDYGSEDLEAKLEKENDSTYTLKQLEGSPIKIVVDRKWVKLPKVMRFKVKSY